MAVGKPFSKLTEDEKLAILDRIKQYREMAATGNSSLMSRMRLQEDFAALGKHWDDAFVEDMEARGKLCMTINMIQPQIKQLLGHIIQNPRDVTMYNSRGGLKMLADLQTALIEHVSYDQNVKHEQAQWAEQGLTTGCSYLGLLRDEDADPKGGNLEVLRLNEFEVLTDPSCRVYDMNKPRVGAKFLIWEPMEDRSYVEAHWPGALEQYGLSDSESPRTLASMIQWFIGGVASGVRSLWQWASNDDVFSMEKLRVPVTHCWWTEYIKVQYFYDLRGDELDAYILCDPKEIKAAKQAIQAYPGAYELRDAVAPAMNHSIALGEVLLDHRVDEFNLLQTGQTLFPVVPFHANFNNGYKAGITESMIGPNTWFNWMRSLALNNIKNQPNSGFVVGGGTPADKSWLQDHAGEDGLVIDKSKYGDFIERIEPANLPPVEALAETGKSEIREVVNLHTDAPEDEPKNMSGFALRIKQQKGITGVSPVLANYDYSVKLWGQLLSAVIRANPVFSDSEIKEIVEEKNLLDPQLLQECRQAVATAFGQVLPQPPEPLDPLMVQALDPAKAMEVKKQAQQHRLNYDMAMAAIDAKAKPMAIAALIDAMRNARRGRYQARVSLSAESMTQRARTLMEIAEINTLLVGNGQQPLSDEYIIDNSDLPHKEDVLAQRGYGK